MALYLANSLYNPNFTTIGGGGGGGSPSGPAGGALTGNYPNPTLGPSGVTGGTYGNGTNVAQITVGSDGRVTNVTNVPVVVGGGSPSGPAGGDLGGLYPNPILAQKNGVAIYGGNDGLGNLFFTWGNPNVKIYHGQQILTNDGTGFAAAIMLDPGATKGIAYIFMYGDGSSNGTYQVVLALNWWPNGGIRNQGGAGFQEYKTNTMGDASYEIPLVPVFNNQIQVNMKNGNGNVNIPVTWKWHAIIIS